VREVAVRTGHSWTSVLLLAGVFGLLQATIIDLSLFTTDRHDISQWDTIIGPTWIEPLGFSAGAAVTWIGGHVLMSIGVPIALAEAVHPSSQGRSWLSPPMIGVVTLVFVAVAGLVHVHEQRAYGASLTPARVVVVAALAAALVVLAVSPRTRPRAGRTGRLPRAWLLVLLGAAVMFAVDCATADWGWTIGALIVCALAAIWLLRRGRRARFEGRGAALLAVGALVERAVVAFLGPMPDQVSALAKYAHNTVFLLLVLAVGLMVLVRSRPLDSRRDRRSDRPTTTG